MSRSNAKSGQLSQLQGRAPGLSGMIMSGRRTRRRTRWMSEW